MEKKVFHIVSHTHWDRAWYGNVYEFRLRLIKLLDKLFNILETNPEFKSFNLDAHTALIEDYLEVYPQKKELIRKYVKEGRITIGPWYVLADEFLVSGESIIKNLLAGEKICKEMGKCLKVGYLIDIFGHIAQMPQILRSFGIKYAVIWRGIEAKKKLNYEVYWFAPDGSSVLTIRLPGGVGYANLSFIALFTPPEVQKSLSSKVEGWDEVEDLNDRMKIVDFWINDAMANSKANVYLFLQGMDFKQPDEKIPSLIQALNEKYNKLNIFVKHSNLMDFFQELENDIKDKEIDKISGTQRDTVFLKEQGSFVLSHVLSSRMDNKIFNRKVERLLEYYTNPSQFLNKLVFNKNYIDYINLAYKWLLRNHPHDNIGGCGVDPMHRQMNTTFEWAYEIGDRIFRDTINNIGECVKVKYNPEQSEIIFGLFNPLPYNQTRTVELEIPVPVECFPKNLRSIEVKELKTENLINAFLLEKRDIEDFNAFWVNNRSFPVYSARKVKILLNDSFKSFGFKFYIMKLKDKPLNNDNSNYISKYFNQLENENLRVIINQNGSLTLIDKRTNNTYSPLNFFVDRGDRGDEYTFSPLLNDEIFTTLNTSPTITLVENNEIRGTFKIEYFLYLPESLTFDREHRSRKRKLQKIITWVSLTKSSEWVEIKTEFVNKIKDHRMQIGFSTGIETKETFADQAFFIEKYNIEKAKIKEENWVEEQPENFPLQNFCAAFNSNRGLAIFSKDLPEFSFENQSIYLTAIRSIEWLARDDLYSREGPAGPVIRTPEAQLLGKKITAEYAVYPVKKHEPLFSIYKKSEIYKGSPAPVITSKWKLNNYNLQIQNLIDFNTSFLEVKGNVAYSTLKPSDKDNSTFVLRIWNPDNSTQDVIIKFNKKVADKIKDIFFTSLNEEKIKSIELVNNEIKFTVSPFRIVSIGIKLK